MDIYSRLNILLTAKSAVLCIFWFAVVVPSKTKNELCKQIYRQVLSMQTANPDLPLDRHVRVLHERVLPRVRFWALDRIHPSSHGGVWNKFLHMELRWIHSLRATTYPGLNEAINYKPFLEGIVSGGMELWFPSWVWVSSVASSYSLYLYLWVVNSAFSPPYLFFYIFYYTYTIYLALLVFPGCSYTQHTQAGRIQLYFDVSGSCPLVSSLSAFHQLPLPSASGLLILLSAPMTFGRFFPLAGCCFSLVTLVTPIGLDGCSVSGGSKHVTSLRTPHPPLWGSVGWQCMLCPREMTILVPVNAVHTWGWLWDFTPSPCSTSFHLYISI